MSYRNAEIAVYGILAVGFLAITILGILGHIQYTLGALFVTLFLILIVCCLTQVKQTTQVCDDEDSCEKANPSGSSNRFSDIALPSAPEDAVNLSIGTASGICKIKVDDPRIFFSALNDSSETITICDDHSSTIIVKDAIEWINFENISKERTS